MQSRAVAKKQKILREARPGGVFGRRIRSAVVGVWRRAGSTSESGQAHGQAGGRKAGSSAIITFAPQSSFRK
jgi:hypothetical protein